MKEKIEGVLSLPYLDQYVVKVFRRLDRFHAGTERIYHARYSEPEKVRRLAKHFIEMNPIIQKQVIEQRIEAWNHDKS